jgi:hypothetical protein
VGAGQFGQLACCAWWWLLLGGLLRILRYVRFHPNLPLSPQQPKNYNYVGLVPTFLLPFFQNLSPPIFGFNLTATWIATPLEASALSNPTLAEKSKNQHEKD